MDTVQQKGHPKGLYPFFFHRNVGTFFLLWYGGILILYLTKTFLRGLAFGQKGQLV